MKAVLYLLTIYLVWGSTYLAMRVGVMEGSGFPPFALGASRFLIAGPILILISYLMKKRIRITASEMKKLVLSGLIIWLTGHGLILWSTQFVDSGYTALIIASSPMWVLIIDSLLNMKSPNASVSVFIFIGFLGVATLVVPKVRAGAPGSSLAVILIVIGTISWAAGSLYQRKINMKLSSLAISGYQQLFAGFGFLATSLLLREPFPHPTHSAWMAWAYLMIFGSIIAFTVYVKILVMLPVNIVMTYAYVNPLVAVILGYLVLNEEISNATLLGGLIIIVSVFGIIMKKGGKVEA
jgi:drug/metabolite transporter (DMT)-like permease